jgi:hypothetical protein
MNSWLFTGEMEDENILDTSFHAVHKKEYYEYVHIRLPWASLLSDFEKLRKAIISFFISVRSSTCFPYVRLSPRNNYIPTGGF